MGYTGLKPADTQTIALGPSDIRDELVGLATGQVVNAGLLNGLASGNTSGKIPVSNGTLNVNLNADKLDGNYASAFAAYTHAHDIATGSSNGFMSNTDFTKLSGVATGSEVNQMAFSNVLVGSTTIAADSKTDTLEITAGANITLTPDATNNKVTIAVSGTVPAATTAGTCSGNAATATNATDHISDTTAAHAASAISCVVTGDVSATNVQSAIAELANEKVATSDVVTAATASKIVRRDTSGNVVGNITGNAVTATSATTADSAAKWTTARTLSITGDVTGSTTFDGSGNASITAVVVDDSHSHTVATLPDGVNYDGGHSFDVNGYQKLSNGLIIQWGKITTASSTWTNWTFPIAFSTACFFAIGIISSISTIEDKSCYLSSVLPTTTVATFAFSTDSAWFSGGNALVFAIGY